MSDETPDTRIEREPSHIPLIEARLGKYKATDD